MKHDWRQVKGINEGVKLLLSKVTAVAIDCRAEPCGHMDQQRAITALEGALKENHHLKALDIFNYNMNESEFVTRLLAAAATSKHLEYLGLWNNRIEDNGAKFIADFLDHRSHLHFVNLHGNLISDKGAITIGKAVAKHQHLKVLNLSYNSIADDGMQVLAKAVEQTVHLKFLDLQHNSCAKIGAMSFAHALEKTQTLKYLNLSENDKIPKIACDAVEDVAKGRGIAYVGPKHTVHSAFRGMTHALRHILRLNSHKNKKLEDFDIALLQAEDFEHDIEIHAAEPTETA